MHHRREVGARRLQPAQRRDAGVAALAHPNVALAASAQPRKLRVGVYADGPQQPRWVVEALAKLAASDFAEVYLIEAGAGRPAAPTLVWQLYGALDRRLFGRAPTDPVALAEHLAGGSPEGQLDIAFALGAIDDACLEGRARYGVWRFCFGADGAQGETLAGLPEVARAEPLSASGLKVRLAADRPVRLAYQSWSRTYPFSVARNRDQLLRKTAEFAYRAVRDLYRSGDGWLARLRELKGPAASAREPGIADVSRIVGRLAHRGVERALHIEQWFLAYRFGGGVSAGLEGFTRLMPPKDRDWADPFVVERSGRYYIFFEELPYASGKAHISMLELDRTGRVSAPQRVLEADHHLSYPYLFEHDGQLYMLPESARNRSVELYRCVDFPLQWKREHVLLDGVRRAAGPLHGGGGGGWLFPTSGVGDSRLFDDELPLSHADPLPGDGQPHAKTPVKPDARSARPAGA